MKEFLKKPIPLAQIPDQEKEPQFVSEPLVPVQETERIHIRMQYPLLGMKHGEKRCMLRKTVYDMLQKASESLEPGYAFLIWDAWRPFALQKELLSLFLRGSSQRFGTAGSSPSVKCSRRSVRSSKS